jgi:hypothetical protein
LTLSIYLLYIEVPMSGLVQQWDMSRQARHILIR